MWSSHEISEDMKIFQNSSLIYSYSQFSEKTNQLFSVSQICLNFFNFCFMSIRELKNSKSSFLKFQAISYVIRLFLSPYWTSFQTLIIIILLISSSLAGSLGNVISITESSYYPSIPWKPPSFIYFPGPLLLL